MALSESNSGNTMRRRCAWSLLIVTLAILCNASSSFIPSASHVAFRRSSSTAHPFRSLDTTTSTSLYMGKKRRSDRKAKKIVEQAKPRTFYDKLKDAGAEVDEEKRKAAEPERFDTVIPTTDDDAAEEASATSEEDESSRPKSKLEQEESGERIRSTIGGEGESVTKAADVASAVTGDDDRPEVSTFVTDESTGMMRVIQGKKVKDVVTGKAVKLSDLGPQYRLAQFFPGVPPDVREKYRFDWGTDVPELVEKLRDVCYVPGTNPITGEARMEVPPHPQVTNAGIDFILANRDQLGYRMKKTLGHLKMRTQSQFKRKEALSYRKLWKHFILLENHISAPFRQMLLDAEEKIGPNFGNLDVKTYLDGDLYERCANYVVLKGMVAHWEQKVRDAEYIENAPDTATNQGRKFYTGDPKRFLPDPPILFKLEDVTRVCLMIQKTTSAFVNTPELFDDLPPELRFVEKALSIKGGTALRQYMIEEFCPNEGITPTGLREGLRRFLEQLDNMQVDPYGDIFMTLGNLCRALEVGTEFDYKSDPYMKYIANPSKDGPGFFQTYTFDFEKESLVRFMDNAVKIEEGAGAPLEEVLFQLQGEVKLLTGLDRFDKKSSDLPYKPPDWRSLGRPHMLGWLDILGGDEEFKGNETAMEEAALLDDPNEWIEYETTTKKK